MENIIELDPLKDSKGFLEQLQSESPRAGVILGAAFLDEQLGELIAGFLIDKKSAVEQLLGDGRPLGFFSARITAAFCLGLITQDERDDLNLIRNVRNRFAHRLHDLTFDDPEIVDRCNSLKIPSILQPKARWDHGDRFVVAVAMLHSRLKARRFVAEKRRCVALEEPKIVVTRV